MLLLLRWQLWWWLAGGCRVQGGSDWDQWLHGVMLLHTALSPVSYEDLVHWNHAWVPWFHCVFPLNWQPVYCGSWFILQTQNCSVKIFANKDGVMRHLVNVKYESLTVDKLFKLSPHHCGWLVSAGLCWHPDNSLALQYNSILSSIFISTIIIVVIMKSWSGVKRMVMVIDWFICNIKIHYENICV